MDSDPLVSGQRHPAGVGAATYEGVSVALAKAARRKMQIIDAAESINDLRIPPGNRLEKLQPPRDGEHSIRVNDQFRICFVWSNGGADDVELTDYH